MAFFIDGYPVFGGDHILDTVISLDIAGQEDGIGIEASVFNEQLGAQLLNNPLQLQPVINPPDVEKIRICIGGKGWKQEECLTNIRIDFIPGFKKKRRGEMRASLHFGNDGCHHPGTPFQMVSL